MINLIRNAFKFTESGSVEIGNYIENDTLCFYVKDTGRGIPASKQSEIFDRFVQVDLRDDRGYEGSGLGLSIVKAYVEALNGDIQVISEFGRGSEFIVSVPYLPVCGSCFSREIVN